MKGELNIMKTEFLKSLGIVDQEVINSIMAENGRDIEKVKAANTTFESEIEGLKKQLGERDEQLKTLKASVKDNETLTQKISALEEENKSAKSKYEGELNALRKDYETEGKLRDAKAKNIKAVKALLNLEEDVDKQIKALSENEDTKFLFDVNEPNKPTGTTPASGNQEPTAQPKSFVDAIRENIKSNR